MGNKDFEDGNRATGLSLDTPEAEQVGWRCCWMCPDIPGKNSPGGVTSQLQELLPGKIKSFWDLIKHCSEEEELSQEIAAKPWG